MAFPLREQQHLPEPEIARRVMAKLEALGIAYAAKRLPGELSAGMAKRVAIARAMVMAPEILVYEKRNPAGRGVMLQRSSARSLS